MKRHFPFLAPLALLAGCDSPPPEPKVTVEGAVVTLPAVPGRASSAYFRLRTNNDPTRLVSIESPRVGRFELHETVSEGGVSRMRPLQQATFSPDEPLAFEPGARHAMVFDIDPAVRAGDRLPLTFRFDPAPPVTVDAEVRGPGAGHAAH